MDTSGSIHSGMLCIVTYFWPERVPAGPCALLLLILVLVYHTCYSNTVLNWMCWTCYLILFSFLSQRSCVYLYSFKIHLSHWKTHLGYTALYFLLSPFLLHNPFQGIWLVFWFLVPPDRLRGSGHWGSPACLSPSSAPGVRCCWCWESGRLGWHLKPVPQLRHADSLSQEKCRLLHSVVYRSTTVPWPRA